MLAAGATRAIGIDTQVTLVDLDVLVIWQQRCDDDLRKGRMTAVSGVEGRLAHESVDASLGRYFGTTDGILVISVPESSRLGLKPGDVVLRVDGRALAGPAHLLRILRSYDPGESIRLVIMRMKKRVTIAGQAGEQ